MNIVMIAIYLLSAILMCYGGVMMLSSDKLTAGVMFSSAFMYTVLFISEVA